MMFFIEMIENEGDKEKIILLYKCFCQQLYYMAYSWTKDQSVAEDLVHETYISIIRYLENIDENVYKELKWYLISREKNSKLKVTDFTKKNNCLLCLKAWNYVATILKHKIVDWSNKKKKMAKYSVETLYDDLEISLSDSTEDNFVEKEKRNMLQQLLNELQSPYKEVLILHYYNNLKTDEIAKMLNKSPENIRQLLRRGRQKLRRCMEESGYYEY